MASSNIEDGFISSDDESELVANLANEGASDDDDDYSSPMKGRDKDTLYFIEEMSKLKTQKLIEKYNLDAEYFGNFTVIFDSYTKWNERIIVQMMIDFKGKSIEIENKRRQQRPDLNWNVLYKYRLVIDTDPEYETSYSIECDISLESTIYGTHYSQILRQRVRLISGCSWETQRLMWIGRMKEGSYCCLSWLPSEIVKFIIDISMERKYEVIKRRPTESQRGVAVSVGAADRFFGICPIL